eukprot:GEMP01034655.1.p1 GENE.GEMP01034655.1~~GEMP01034655.1.p1  ORF type:complete len:607 (+),score=108.06 GEMP01034655.1:150-1970(+)
MTRADEKPPSTGRTTDFEEILKCIGQFGCWQRWIVLWMSVVIAICAAATVAYTFLGFVPKFRCRIPSCDLTDASFFSVDTEFPDYAFSTTNDTGALELGRSCKYYAPLPNEITCTAYINALKSSNTASLNDRYDDCVDKIFDTTIVVSSVATQYDVTCEKEFWIDTIASLFKVGVLLGAFFFGFLGDNYGRMVALVVGAVIATTCGVLSIFMPNLASFATLAVGIGFGTAPMFAIPFLITLESTGPRYAVALSILIELPWSIGGILLGFEAYMVRDWVHLSLMAYVPLAFVIVVYWFVPESPRWLLAVGRTKEARQIIEKAALMNGTTFPSHLMPPQNDDELSSAAADTIDVEQSEEQQSEQVKPPPSTVVGFRDLFASRVMRLRTLNLFWHWASVIMSFYGLTYASVTLFGSKHLNFILSCAMETLGIVVCITCINSVGRKRLLAASELCGGMACILSGLLSLIKTDDDKVHVVAGHSSTILSFVGKICATCAFCIIYLYTAELYPTVLRSTAIGTCSTVGRIGGICAYLLSLLKSQWTPTPTVVFGCCSLTAGVLALALPETAGLPIPETFEEATTIEARNKERVSRRFPRSFRELVTEPTFAE